MQTKDSYLPSPSKQQKTWYLIDAEDKILGRVASEVSKVLMGSFIE